MAETVHPTREDGSLDPGEGVEGQPIQQGTPVAPTAGNPGAGLGEDSNGNPTEPYPGPAERPASWSAVDPNYVELLTDAEAEAQQDTDDDLIDPAAPVADLEEVAKLQGPEWATYELWGRNVDDGGQWQLVATEKFDGELEAEVGDLDTDSTHEYKVRLVDADGRRSKFSEVIQVTTPSDLTPPPAPTAPVLDQLMSSIDLSWDGTLTAATPEDLSHASLYIRQLHPVGDPSGAAGDSRRVTRFSEAGTWSTASLPEALHEAWLTAVDTTGNESSASATVEFTPAPRVDEQAIRDDLAAAEERLSDAVAASDAWSASAMNRTDELAADTSQAQAKATEAAQAAADAQASYDELSERAQRQIDALIERGDSLVVNGSFEKADPNSANNLLGWTRNNTTSGSRSTQAARTGEASARLAASATTDPPSTIFSTAWPTDAGRTYRTRIWAWKTTHGDDADNAGFQLFVRLHHSDGSISHLWGEESGRSFGVGGFGERVEDFTLPADDTIVEARCCARALPGSGVYLADDAAGFDITEAAEALAAAQSAEQAAQDAHAAAGDAESLAASAMDRAGKVGGRLGGTTAPTGTAPENTLWFQWSDLDDPNRTVVGLWQMIDGSWVAQDTSDQQAIPHLDIGVGTVGVLTAVRIDVASLYAHDGFITNMHSEVVNALRLTGEVGFIGGVLLEDETVTAPKIVASDELTAKIAQFLRVKAVHIDANDIVFNSGIVGELEAHGITLSAEVTDRRFEISGEGWVLTDTSTGEVLASVGVDGTITMRDAEVRGRFQTSYDSGAGLTIDYGTLSYYSLQAGAMRSTTAPYIRLGDGSGGEDDQPAITVRNSELVVAPGRDTNGAARYVSMDGRVLMNSGVSSADFTASNFHSSDHPFNADMNAAQLRFTAEDNSRVFGIGQSGYRLKIWGQLPVGHGQDDTIVSGGTSSFNSLSAGNAVWGTFTYGTAPRVGKRTPFPTARLSTGSRDAYRVVDVSTAAAGTSGFNWVARAHGENNGDASYLIDYVAFWNRD